LEALEGFVNHVLSVSNEEFAYWHQTLLESMGEEKLAIVTELLPELKVITDISNNSDSNDPPASPVNDKNMFVEAFVSFIAAIARPEEPLVIFLDDIEASYQ
jgi:predicted ATPase